MEPQSTGGANTAGTIFSISTAGKERVLHSFGGRVDGEEPVTDLTLDKDMFYGATYRGGTINRGTVFAFKLQYRREDVRDYPSPVH